MKFSSTEWQRYTRHIQLAQIGAVGQIRLKSAKVLIVGAGGLGSPVSLYLAAAGVGNITIIDGDTVDLSNLQRQILFDVEDIGKPKAEIAQQKLLALNPDIQVTGIAEHLSSASADHWVKQADLVLDCTDNFATRYLINDSCYKLSKPWVFASIFQFSGQCVLFTPETACFRCLFPEAPTDALDCNSAGVLGVLPGLLGTFQANEALKYLAGLDCALKNRLLIVEAIAVELKKIKLAKNPECRCCGNEETVQKSIEQTDSVSCVTDQLSSFEISPQQSIEHQAKYLWLDVRSAAEREAFHLGGEHIPLDDLPDKVSRLSQEKPVLCYCQSGIRSQKAAESLRQSGVEAFSLQGGLVAYLKV